MTVVPFDRATPFPLREPTAALPRGFGDVDRVGWVQRQLALSRSEAAAIRDRMERAEARVEELTRELMLQDLSGGRQTCLPRRV